MGGGRDGQGGSGESLGLPPASSLLCCIPASGPMVCPRAVGEAVPVLGQLPVGHSRLLAEGTKEEEKREEDVALSSALGERGRGRPRRDNRLGKLRVLNPAARGNLPARRRRQCCPPIPSLRKGGVRRGGGVSVLVPRLLRSSPGTFLIRCYLTLICLEMALARMMMIKIVLRVSPFSWGRFWF